MKLTNRKIWYLVLGLWGMVFAGMSAKNFLFNKEKMVDAFLENDYAAVAAKVEGFGELPGSYLVEEERSSLVKEAAKVLGITEPYYLENCTEPDLETVTLCKPSKNGKTTISFQVKTQEAGNLEKEARQFLNIELELSESVESALEYGDLLRQIFELYGMEGKVAVNYEGTIPGELDNKEKNALGDELLGKLSAKVVQEYRGDDLFTIYGYTKMLDSYETVSGEKMNVNIAITYDEVKNESRVYLATPYLMEDY